MEFNIDAIRAVLQYIKDNTKYENDTRIEKAYFIQGDIVKGVPESDKYTSNDVAYSIELLLDTDLIKLLTPPTYLPTGQLKLVKINRLTIEDYSFLEKTQNPTVWEAVKNRAKAVGEFPLKGVCGIATTLGTAMLKDPHALDNFIEGTKHTIHILSGM